MAKPLKILVFEDDPALTKLLSVTLEQKGHHVEIYNNPTVCPVYVDHEKGCPKNEPCADVIITDLMMPHMNGVDFLMLQRQRGCKALDANKAIITGASISNEMIECIDVLGCKLFMKPFRLYDFIAWIDECAERLDS